MDETQDQTQIAGTETIPLIVRSLGSPVLHLMVIEDGSRTLCGLAGIGIAPGQMPMATPCLSCLDKADQIAIRAVASTERAFISLELFKRGAR